MANKNCSTELKIIDSQKISSQGVFGYPSLENLWQNFLIAPTMQNLGNGNQPSHIARISKLIKFCSPRS